MDLNKQMTYEVEAVKSMKERGVIEDYRFNEKAGIVWVKAEGEWFEVWSIEEVLASHTPREGA